MATLRESGHRQRRSSRLWSADVGELPAVRAPHVAIVTTDRSLGVYGAVDCGLFVQSFLLAAASRGGVATIPQAAIASQAPLVREHLNLSDDRLVLLGISFGYADEAHPANGYRTPRQGISDVVTWRSAD